MATNKSMIKALERIEELISELGAWRKVLKDHITQQKSQHGKDYDDKYTYYQNKKRQEKGLGKRVYD